MRRVLVWIIPFVGLAGCATLPDGRLWGKDVTFSPGWERVRASAMQAARDPWVWAPLAGAAGLQINGWDRKVSTWAMRETPVFGSQEDARTWSNDLRDAAAIAELTTVLVTPSGDDAHSWFVNKLKGYAVDFAAESAAGLTTHILKSTTGRTRPSQTNDRSFPSGHTSQAATNDRLAARNLEFMDMNPVTRRTLVYGLDAVTLATAWARVEAGAHYPSDTLFSIALGNFSANFFKNAFMGSGDNPRQAIAVTPTDGGLMLNFSTRF
ncbi:MAG: phosphatase PAP2 family protein [Gammaproteobacteria bacterium]|nr:phosphatase PAP2 family protein [Gammaproteobacteria bacterium]